MEKVIIVRYAEIHLKGKNRGYFERVFCVNLEKALKGLRHELRRTSGRYLVAAFDERDADEICARISRVFGVHSYSVGYRVPNDLESILEAAKIVCPRSGTFKVDTHRADKKYPMTSPELNAEVGARLLAAFPSLKVNVHEPQGCVYLDIREDGSALVFGTFEEGVGGMPVGTSSKGLLLISGGIDSPVAGYMMAKRGMEVGYLHFHSYPYTNEQAKDKVVELARILSRYAGGDPQKMCRGAQCHAPAPLYVPYRRARRACAGREVPDHGREPRAGRIADHGRDHFFECGCHAARAASADRIR